MLNSIRGSLCIYGTTEVMLSSNTSTSSKNNYYFEKHFGVYRSDYFWLDLLRECRYLKLVWTIQEETFESRRTNCFGRRQRTYVPSLRADISFIPFVAQRKGTI